MSVPMKRPLIATPWDDVVFEPHADYLVKGLLTASTMSCVYGEPGCGKSFLALDIAARIALGWEWHQCRVRRAGVVYIAGEGSRGITNRIEAFKRRFAANIGDVPFEVVSSTLDLRRENGDRQQLVELVNSLKLSERPGLIVVDTLSRAFGGGDENSSADMTGFVANCDWVRDRTGCHVMLVHHSGKDKSKGGRGHSSLLGAVDTELEITRADDGLRTLRVTKQRDGVDGQTFAFRLEPVELGTDQDGDPVTSCVVVPADAPPPQAKRYSLNPRHRLALENLDDLLAREGKPAPASSHIPNGAVVVPIDRWRDHLRAAGVLDADRKASTVREAFRRIKERLLAIGAIAIFDGLVWKP